jgi:hypothetical protein
MDLDIHDFETVNFENLNGLVHFLWQLVHFHLLVDLKFVH